MRSVLDELVDDLPPISKANRGRSSQTARAWNALAERHARVANAANAQGDALSTIFQTSLSLVDVRSNEIMKKLSGWAAIIAVPTLVTGFVGMNVSVPARGFGRRLLDLLRDHGDHGRDPVPAVADPGLGLTDSGTTVIR